MDPSVFPRELMANASSLVQDEEVLLLTLVYLKQIISAVVSSFE